ncbi:cobyrinate a,c-diamide synthase [Phaeovibrio sulfidiphilus]|uniref:Cobyrinate a,c-diamide synthase n=1 Tax=Phaeovibrio sulfidiphilus TaxID=1220600 RepID=A0A8J6YNL6_9PROT|nr:cobyrinate a,c-diamide synthase [Phaeovibrio sulfidiphilus]MBE1237930.1 cobyrinate a,c-diamide synthase [Phaeovibrio sulfidiphilus]
MSTPAPAPFPGIIVAAPASRSGKTTFTLGLLRTLRNRGLRATGFKVGPDYLDPAYHAAAASTPCYNLDTWANPPEAIRATIALGVRDSDLAVAEGALGLFDGAIGVPDAEQNGSAAALALQTGWPVILVVPVNGMGASAAAVVEGFARHRPDVHIRGVVLNMVGSERQGKALTEAIEAATPDIPVLGLLPRDAQLGLPERHLGLVQAREHTSLEEFLDGAGALVGQNVDVARLVAIARAGTRARPVPLPPPGQDEAVCLLPAPGNRIAVARDDAFAFAYPAVLEGWRARGADIVFFSPLANEAPARDADAVYLPGGYPELHAETLANAGTFLAGLREAAGRSLPVYGECGGYMVLGDLLTDSGGKSHPMAGLLPVETSFHNPKRHLGYREVTVLEDSWLGPAGSLFRGHEFHYSIIREAANGHPLFACRAADGTDLGAMGHRRGSVSGSFVHLIAHRTSPNQDKG